METSEFKRKAEELQLMFKELYGNNGDNGLVGILADIIQVNNFRFKTCCSGTPVNTIWHNDSLHISCEINGNKWITIV